jgi:hypothetical protein
MSLLSIAVLSVAAYVLRGRGGGGPMATVLLAIASLLLLAFVRTTALFPAVASIVLVMLVFRARVNRWIIVGLAVAAVALLVMGPRLSHMIGGSEMNYKNLLSQTAVNPDEQFLEGFSWKDRSIGRLLVPHGSFEAAAFAVPRILDYLVAPLPTIGVTRTAIAAGDWFNWQQLLVVLSAFVYVALLPCALASLLDSFRNRKAGLALHIPLWITMLAIASGTAIIHERYRVMAALLLWGCIWLGAFAPRKQLLFSYMAWVALLFAGSVVVILYKSGMA